MAKGYDGRASKSFSGGSGAHGMNSYRNNSRGSTPGSVGSVGQMFSDAFRDFGSGPKIPKSVPYVPGTKGHGGSKKKRR